MDYRYLPLFHALHNAAYQKSNVWCRRVGSIYPDWGKVGRSSLLGKLLGRVVEVNCKFVSGKL
jgi:hypothetical protein